VISKTSLKRLANQSSINSLSNHSSSDNLKPLKHRKTEKKSFIKPKHKPRNFSENQEDPEKKSSSKEKIYPTCLKDYALLDEITSKFTLKTIEAIKKDFPNNEVIYTHFLAILSELDSIFDKNQHLQFSMSRARDVFQLYTSRPGHVLNTLKLLPKLAETVRVSKTVISQSAAALKTLEKSKVSGIALEVMEGLKLVISIQNKMFKSKVFVPSSKGRAESRLGDEKNLEVSIMELTTQPFDTENRSVSPIVQTFQTEPDDFTTEKSEKPKDFRSSKEKILEQLFQRIKSIPSNKENQEQVIKKPVHESSKSCLKELNQNVHLAVKPSSIKLKQKRAASNSPLPGYMQGLKRQDSLGSKGHLPQKVLKKAEILIDKKKEWEEIRFVSEN
jgi:hypothetical protein